jgi:hypothetical protein
MIELMRFLLIVALAIIVILLLPRWGWNERFRQPYVDERFDYVGSAVAMAVLLIVVLLIITGVL